MIRRAITLGYPRSGATLTQYILERFAPRIFIDKLHGHDIIRNNIPPFVMGEHSMLVLVIRNYRECIMSQLTRGNQQNDPARIKMAFIEYMMGIATYDKSQGCKTYIYYEDFILNPVDIITHLGEMSGNQYQHILKDLDTYIKLSFSDYKRKLGQPLTSGKETTHFTPLTYNNYDFDWTHEVRNINEELYDKYLIRYGEVNE